MKMEIFEFYFRLRLIVAVLFVGRNELGGGNESEREIER